MTKWFKYIVLLYSYATFSQTNVFCRIDTTIPNTINMKWYFPNLIGEEGFYVHRKESTDSLWKQLTSSPVLFKSYKPSTEELKQDKELKNYLEFASKPQDLKGIALIAVLIKSFKSSCLSKYLGIWFDDKSVEHGKTYQYKIVKLNNNRVVDSAISNPISFTNYTPIEPPKEIKFIAGNKKVSFTWHPEPNRYYGVNIFRQHNDSTSSIKLTKEPIILSKTKNTNGEDIYGREFYVDLNLSANTNYLYTFEAIDFFGAPSEKSKPIRIKLKDLDPPKAPDTLYYKLSGKKVNINWKKYIKENDLAGYNIYRTVKTDTDFVKLNSTLISKDDSSYVDTVPSFGSYLCAISSVDSNLNETISNSYHIEVVDTEAPAKPKNLRIKADSTCFRLFWDKNHEQDLKGYLLYRTINKDDENTYVKITPKPISDSFYVDALSKNLKNNFLYKLIAVDESLNRSPYSEFISARMPDLIAPQDPFLKRVFLNEKKQVIIEWFLNTETDLKGYNIYRNVNSDSLNSFTKLNGKPINKSSSKYTDRYTVTGNIHTYYIEALDSAGNLSKHSNILKVYVKTTDESPVMVITNFAAKYDAKKTQVELNWKLKNESNLKSKIVYKKKQGETIFTPLSEVSDAKKLIDHDISSGEQYTYQLRIYNQVGDVVRSKNISLSIH